MENGRSIIAALSIFMLVAAVSATTTLTITVIDDCDDSAVKGASIYVAGSYVGTTDSSGEYVYSHSRSSNFRVSVEKSGYEYWTDIISDSRTSLEVELERESGILTINIMDGDTLEPIEDAVVEISGSDIDDSDSTDEDGSVDFDVFLDGTYIVEVEKENYETLYKEVEMDDDTKEVDYLLQRNDLVIFDVTDPETDDPVEGASIYVDGDLEGETGSDGRLSVYIDHEKSYDIEVTKEGYQSFEETHYFESDDIIYSVSLSVTLYPVAVSVYNSDKVPIENAEVYIDDVFFGKTDEYGQSDTTNLVAGNHTFEVRKSGYSDWSEVVTIDGSNGNIIAIPEYIRADVTVIVEDADHNPISGVSVAIDGETAGTTNAAGTVKTELLTNEGYVFSAAKDGYKDLSQSESIPLGSTEFTVTLTMESTFNVLLVAGVVLIILILAIVLYVSGSSRRRRGSRRRPPTHRGGGGEL